MESRHYFLTFSVLMLIIGIKSQAEKLEQFQCQALTPRHNSKFPIL